MVQVDRLTILIYYRYICTYVGDHLFSESLALYKQHVT